MVVQGTCFFGYLVNFWLVQRSAVAVTTVKVTIAYSSTISMSDRVLCYIGYSDTFVINMYRVEQKKWS